MDTIKTFFDNIWESLTKSQKTEVLELFIITASFHKVQDVISFHYQLTQASTSVQFGVLPKAIHMKQEKPRRGSIHICKYCIQVFSKGVESAPETVHIAEEYSDASDTLQTQNEEHSMKDTCMEVITLQVCVTGQTFNSEQQFLNQVAECLQGCGIHLQREVYNHESDEPLLLFCPVVSRAGTDIHHALENISSHRKVVLVVMHHAPNPNLMLYTASQSQTQHSSLVSVVDCRFSQGSGLYSCQMNTTAVTSVASSIEQLVLLSKETCVN
ncbi:uncharacterized protein LOC115467022 isoform X2 [Microcaecilia unicolor]|uniref:Uncharacterized protein LOC115467022 isoform X2 n=1 Tax=Microcaecilia unicolor TaxID=1415580 RepID=A0A6P7XG76_9AMPH|nr:uncharacterized protein LOC115467022 isoform X2 [Microcaecilia unicolor]